MTTLNNVTIEAIHTVRVARTLTNAELRKQVKSDTGLSVRRLDNFTLTGMLCVFQLLGGNKMSLECGLYAGAEYFSIELLQTSLINQQQNIPLRPLDFIATVGNAANFYIAKEYNLTGPNNFIGVSELAIEKLLWLCNADFKRSTIEQAVVMVWHETNDERVCTSLLLSQKKVETTMSLKDANHLFGQISEQAISVQW